MIHRLDDFLSKEIDRQIPPPQAINVVGAGTDECLCGDGGKVGLRQISAISRAAPVSSSRKLGWAMPISARARC